VLPVQHGDHVGATFASPAAFVASTVMFTEQAIRAAAQVMIFPGDPHRDDPTGFRAYLREHSPAIAAASARGQVQVADSRQMQLAVGRFDPTYLGQAYAAASAQAVSAGYRGLWVSVDMSWAAGVDPAALTAFEANAYPLFTSGKLTALCQYDQRTFPATVASAACAAHPAAPDSPQPLRHQRHPGNTLHLSGETDLTNRTAFTALLHSLRAGDTLDITAMTFVDLRGLAAIAGQRRRLADLTVRASTYHSKVLHLVGTDHRIARGLTPAPTRLP
jgi:MEDS: MEthanogen/methylotroph, DcmR Sensory domain